MRKRFKIQNLLKRIYSVVLVQMGFFPYGIQGVEELKLRFQLVVKGLTPSQSILQIKI